MKLVSVVIPAYQHAIYLERAIQSVLDQDYASIEIIVVNDGSTESTRAVLAKFEKYDNVKVIHQANQGLPAARNTGLSHAKGEYINFLDSDDYFLPSKISRQVAILEQDQSAGFVYCNIHILDQNNKRVLHSWKDLGRELSGNIFGTLLRGGYFPPHTVLLRRVLLEKEGFDEELGGYADYELWLRLSAQGHKAIYLDEVLAFYFLGLANMSKNWQHMSATREEALIKIFNRYPDVCAKAVSEVYEENEDLRRLNGYLSGRISELIKKPFLGRITFLPGPKKISRLYREYKNKLADG